MTRKDAIKKALDETYRGRPTEACAISLNRDWENLADAAMRWGENLLHEVHMHIWNWFPGGGTAEIAAGRVVEAVNAYASD